MDFVTLISLVFSLIALVLAFVLEGGILGALLEPTEERKTDVLR